MEITNSKVSGNHSPYLIIPNGSCSLRVDTGRLSIFVKVQLKDTLPFQPESPAEFVLKLSCSDGAIVTSPTSNRTDSLSQMRFYTGKKGGVLEFKFQLDHNGFQNQIDLMNNITSIDFEELAFYTKKMHNPDSLIYNNDSILDPKKYLDIIEDEISCYEKAIQDIDPKSERYPLQLALPPTCLTKFLLTENWNHSTFSKEEEKKFLNLKMRHQKASNALITLLERGLNFN